MPIAEPRFTCTMVLADPSGSVLAKTVGLFEGRIGQAGEVPKGDNGFGYDPLFLVAPGFKYTSAELSPAEKNGISHRGKAVSQMIESIHGVFKDN